MRPRAGPQISLPDSGLHVKPRPESAIKPRQWRIYRMRAVPPSRHENRSRGLGPRYLLADG